MTDSGLITALNELIAVSLDGQKDFGVAARDAREPQLTRLFSDGEQLTRAAAAELQDQVRVLGGTAREDGSMRAAASRGWRNFRSMVGSRDDQEILEQCERGASDIRTRYADALRLDLPVPIRALVERHNGVIVDHHYRVLDLRNRLRDAAGVRALRAND